MRKGILIFLAILMIHCISFSNMVYAQMPESDDFESFLWIRPQDYQHKRYMHTVMSFAKRNDLTLAIPHYSGKEIGNFEGILKTAKEYGLFAWVNTGWFLKKDGYTARKLIDDPAIQEKFAAEVKEVAKVYNRYYPGGRIFLFHEEPRVSNWEGGVKQVIKYGPEIFEDGLQVVKAVNPDIEVGLFINPYDIRKIYPDFTERLSAMDIMPDFSFVDFYRGYRDPAHGLETTNKQIQSQINAAKKHTEERPVYYLGQAHTINNNYTPGIEAINQTITATLDADVKAIGWYIRTKYRKTDAELNEPLEPFLPNEGTVDSTDLTNTFTFSRDRLIYAVMRTIEQTRPGFEAKNKFDLWLSGFDFDFNEGSVYLESKKGSWDFIGYYGTYVGGDNPYSLDDRVGTIIFHALDRSKYLRSYNGKHKLKMKIVTDSESDGATLNQVYVLPYQPTDQYVTEREAQSLLQQGSSNIKEQKLVMKKWKLNGLDLAGDSSHTVMLQD